MRAKGISPSVLVLIIIASVMLSMWGFYATAMFDLPGGGGFGGGGVIATVGCSAGNCTACADKDPCVGAVGCDWKGSNLIQAGIVYCFDNKVSRWSGSAISQKDTTLPFKGMPAALGISEVDVLAGAVSTVNITMAKLAGKPYSVSAPNGIVYAYYEIRGQAASLTNVKASFTVDNAWMDNNGIGSDTLKVWRAADGESSFTELDSTIAGAANGNGDIITASADGFSYWAVTGEQVCSGAVSLSLPSTAETGQTVTASASGLSYCAGHFIYIKKDTCAGTAVCTITAGASGGSCSFALPSTEGDYNYAACVDISGSGTFSGSGESDTATVAVSAPAITGPVCGDGTCDAGETPTTCPADCTNIGGDNGTGGVTGPTCGNNILEIGEDCEGKNLGGKTCANIGQDFTGGTLKCGADCLFDTSGCIAAVHAVTAQDALAAVKSATDAITTARTDGKDVTSAVTLLNGAIAAYNTGDYASAKTKAEAAQLAAEAAQKSEAELPILNVLIVMIMLIAVGGGLYYFFRPGKSAAGRKKSSYETAEIPGQA